MSEGRTPPSLQVSIRRPGGNSTVAASGAASVGTPAALPALDTGRLFEILADPTRRRILGLLLDLREICVCRMVGALAQPQPKVSRHLACLRQAGLVVSRRQGTWILYRLDPRVPGWATRVLMMMVEGARLEPEYARDRARLANLPPCNDEALPT
jgi:ArsR family transcriptional regulator